MWGEISEQTKTERSCDSGCIVAVTVGGCEAERGREGEEEGGRFNSTLYKALMRSPCL